MHSDPAVAPSGVLANMHELAHGQPWEKSLQFALVRCFANEAGKLVALSGFG
jgi:hypothetical protein